MICVHEYGKKCHLRANWIKIFFEVELKNYNTKIKSNLKRKCETKAPTWYRSDTDTDLVSIFWIHPPTSKHNFTHSYVGWRKLGSNTTFQLAHEYTRQTIITKNIVQENLQRFTERWSIPPKTHRSGVRLLPRGRPLLCGRISVRSFWTPGAHPQGLLETTAHYSSFKTQQHTVVRRVKNRGDVWLSFIMIRTAVWVLTMWRPTYRMQEAFQQRGTKNPGCVLTFRMRFYHLKKKYTEGIHEADVTVQQGGAEKLRGRARLLLPLQQKVNKNVSLLFVPAVTARVI